MSVIHYIFDYTIQYHLQYINLYTFQYGLILLIPHPNHKIYELSSYFIISLTNIEMICIMDTY